MTSACLDSTYDNFDQREGTPCLERPEFLCMEPGATNKWTGEVHAWTVSAPWLCTFDIWGCDDPTADNYRSDFAKESGAYNTRFNPAPTMCQWGGCNDTTAMNYWSKATYNTGICKYPKK